MTQLTGPQVAQLQTALLDTFDQPELAQMVKVSWRRTWPASPAASR